MPERPSAAWGKLDQQVARAYNRRLGNLALLRTRTNSEIGNRGFNAKKKLYRTSKFSLTKELSALRAWGPKEIEARQVKLAAMAVETWSLSTA